MVGIKGSSFSLKYSMFFVSFPHVSFTMDTETSIQENHWKSKMGGKYKLEQ